MSDVGLTAMVARDIMRLAEVQVAAGGLYYKRAGTNFLTLVPSYSHDVAAAWLVVAELTRLGWDVEINTYAVDRHECPVRCEVIVKPGEVMHSADTTIKSGMYGQHESVAYAICEAALSIRDRVDRHFVESQKVPR